MNKLELINEIFLDTRSHGVVITSGQPTAEQLKAALDAGRSHVIRISTLESGLEDEADVCAALGLDYLHIPVPWAAPQLEHLRAFFAALESRRDARLLVHCAKNYRVSVFMGAYLVSLGQWTADKAREHALSVFEPDQTWTAFMDAALGFAAVQRQTITGKPG